MGGELERPLASLTNSCLGSTSLVPLELSKRSKWIPAGQVHQRGLASCSLELPHKQLSLSLPPHPPPLPLHFILGCIRGGMASAVLSGVLPKDYSAPRCLPSQGHFHRRGDGEAMERRGTSLPCHQRRMKLNPNSSGVTPRLHRAAACQHHF